ncbi:ROK family protein [Streptomyces sp. NPDC006879]|uniref:ROK family transcriptional regulator n=1 Tax=Streptomyces sp. NPDC006879 TaxID=3364767 RepID=UPI0036BF33BE
MDTEFGGVVGQVVVPGAAVRSSGRGVNLPALRDHNATLVLDLLRAAGAQGTSRPELADRTGLTPQAVSKITSRLREQGLVAEAGRRASTGGKPSTLLRLVPQAGYAVGLHLDREESTAVLVDLSGRVLAARAREYAAGADTPPALAAPSGPDPEALLDFAVFEVAALLAGAREAGVAPAGLSGTRLLGVGVAAPGPLDHRAGVLGRVTGLPAWEGVTLRDDLSDRLGVPVVLDKDTNAAALGFEPSPDSFAYLHLGSGLGAGLVLGGALHRGARTMAGEFGHQVMQLDGPVCGCGQRGCLEVLTLAAVAARDLPWAARLLGAGAANLVALLDLDRVWLGGRVIESAPQVFLREVARVLAGQARRTGASVVPPVLLAQGYAAPGGAPGVGGLGGAGTERWPVAEGAAQLLLGPLFGRGARE